MGHELREAIFFGDIGLLLHRGELVAFIGEAGGKDTDFRVAVEGKIGGSVEVGFIDVLNGFGEDGAV